MRGAAVLTLVLALAAAGAPAAQAAPERPVIPERYDVPPEGRRLAAGEVLRIALARPEIRRERSEHRLAYARAHLLGRDRWRVSVFAPPERRGERSEEVAQAIVADRDGRVIEAWTGPQVAWSMARGYPGAFGGKANALWLWLALSTLFVLPFLRPPLRLLHLDLAVLLAFGVSYAFFCAARIGVSVPLVYPLLLYLLARMLGIAVARARGRSPVTRPPLALAVPVAWLGIGVVFLLGFRAALNVVGGNVIDVGYSGVIGADLLTHGEPLYGGFPADDPRGDTYGPVLYYAYVPFELALPWSGAWDSLPAARAAALAFDGLCVLGLWLLGRRWRGPGLGVLLAWLWVTFPFTLLVSNSSANDALPAALVVLALLWIASPARRSGALALAALTKFAPLALLPLFAAYRGGPRPGQWEFAGAAAAPVALRGRVARELHTPLLTLAGFALVALVALAPVLGDPVALWERTLGFQADRGSPFSIWGLWGLGAGQAVAAAGALGLAVAAAVWPRRRDVVVVAALGAAVLIAAQIAADHWFYLYLVWFLPLLLVALLAGYPIGGLDAPPSPSERGLDAPRSAPFTGRDAAPARSRPHGPAPRPG